MITTHHLSQPNRDSKDLFCNYCRKSNHIKEECFKLQRKERSSKPTQSSQPSTSPVATVEDSPNSSSFTSNEIAFVNLSCGKEIITDTPFVVVL